MTGRVTGDSPFFALALAEIRGFDLGDDDELLAELRERRDADAGALDGDDWLLLGVLLHREVDRTRPGTSHPDAVACFERAAQLGPCTTLAHFLRGHVHLRLHRLDDAEQAFLEAEDSPEQDGACPPSELLHARGRIALARGDARQALDLFRRGLELDPASAARWWDTAQVLVDLGHVEDGRAAIERTLGNDPEHAEALYERAALVAEADDPASVADALAKAIAVAEPLRERARDDARFAGVRSSGAMAAVLDPPAPELDWLDALPDWSRLLRANDETASLGIEWLGSAESEQIAAAVTRAHDRSPPGVMYSDAMLARARELLRSMRPVAYGPSTRSRARVTERSLLWVDLERPHELWLALSRHFPPQLWLPAGTSSQSLSAALCEYFPLPRRRRLDMHGIARGFLGYRLRFGVPNPQDGKIEPANALELDRHFGVNPFVDTAYWGSAYDDDPWPDEIPPQPGEMLKMSARQRRVAEQAPGQVWSVSRRTRHTRSYLSIELHHRDIFVAEVRYRPANSQRVVERLNAELGCDYPLDMPVDAIAALLGFQFEQVSDLQTRLDSTADPEEIAGLLLVLSALRHSDMAVLRVYRRYMDHPESVVRTTLCNVFVAHNHESLLEEMSATEPDDDIRAQIEAVLDDGIGVVQYDPYTDYDESDIDFGLVEDDEHGLDVEVEAEEA